MINMTKKKDSILTQLKREYKRLEKPTVKVLLKTTGQILCVAIAAALIIKGFDIGFESIITVTIK